MLAGWLTPFGRIPNPVLFALDEVTQAAAVPLTVHGSGRLREALTLAASARGKGGPRGRTAQYSARSR
jgi:hypothetical protein